MATIPREEPQVWVVGATAPALEAQFGEEDEAALLNLNGYAAQVVFSYITGSSPHKVGPAKVRDPNNGVVLYERDGTEAPSAGRLMYQIEVMHPGSPDSTVEEWGTFSSGPFKVQVVESE
jgi:hypothetical protein